MIVFPNAVSLFLCIVPVSITNKAPSYDGIPLIPVFQDIVRTLIVVGFDVLKRVDVANFQQIAFPIGEIVIVTIPHDDCVVILLDVMTISYHFSIFVYNQIQRGFLVFTAGV